MSDGLFNDKLVLGGVEFTGFDFQGGVELLRDFTLEISTVPSTYQIENYDSSSHYLITLGSTSNSTYSYLVGLPLPSNYYSISSTGLVTINTIVGTFYMKEFRSSDFSNLGVV